MSDQFFDGKVLFVGRNAKPTVPEVLPLVNKLYARDSAGCCWHVVLDESRMGPYRPTR